MKRLNLQMEYKEQSELRLYDPNDRENTTYVYFSGGLRATRLKASNGGRLFCSDLSLVYADTVPMLTLKELKDRYHVSFTYLYGDKKQQTTARGEINDVLTGCEPPELLRGYGQKKRSPLLELQSHELSPADRMWINSFMAYDSRMFAKMFWFNERDKNGKAIGSGIDTSLNSNLRMNLPPLWVNMNFLTFRAKRGAFTQTVNV